MTIAPRGQAVLTAGIVLVIVETFAVLLRLLAKRKCKASLTVDDWFIIASLFPSYGMLIVGGSLVTKGHAGKHTADLSPSEFTLFLKLSLTGMVTYALTITIVKLSILLLYRRIFATERFRKITTVLILLCISWFWATFFATLFRCRPVRAAWNPDLSKHCMDYQAFYYGATSTNLIIDVLVLGVPLYVVWGLQLQRKDKIALSAILSVGIFSCVAGLLVIVTAGDLNSGDIVYTSTTSYMFSSIEPSTAMICACLATYRPLFTALNAKISTLSFGKGKSYTPKSSPGYLELTSTTKSVVMSPSAVCRALSSNPPARGQDGLQDRTGEDANRGQIRVQTERRRPSDLPAPLIVRWRQCEDEKPLPVTPIDEERAL